MARRRGLRFATDLAYFEARYVPEPNTGCWLWMNLFNNGYGQARYNEYAHRASYRLFRGNIPEGLFVCHKCDTPSCVNPDHLFLGTNADNVGDSVNKKRNAFGERNGHAKLTEALVIEALQSPESGGQFALKHGVSRSLITAIRRGQRWQHLQGRTLKSQPADI